MNKQIEAYIYDVVRRLPESQRSEVSAEIYEMLEDLLMDQPNIEKVLNDLGHPSHLAAKYRENPRYLISPDYFDQYLNTLKFVVPIVFGVGASVIAIINVLDLFSIPPTASDIIVTIARTISSTLSGGFGMSLYSAVVITVIYAIMDYHQRTSALEKWTVDNLPNVPSDAHVEIMRATNQVSQDYPQTPVPQIKKISRGDTAFELIMSVAFIILLLYLINNKINIPLYLNGESIHGILNIQHLRLYIPALVGLGLFGLLLGIVKIIIGYWRYSLAHLSLISNVASMIIFSLLILTPEIFSVDFINFMNSRTHENVILYIKLSFLGFMAVGYIIDTIVNYYKAYKNAQQPSG